MRGGRRKQHKGRPEAIQRQMDAFVREYLVDLDGGAAATRAGYSAKTSRQQACRLLAMPEIAAAVERGMAARAQRTEVKQDQVLRELALLMTSDVRNYTVDAKSGKLVLAPGAPADAMRAVSSVKYRTRADGTTEVDLRLWDKPAALRMAGQHLGMFLERVQHEFDPSVLSDEKLWDALGTALEQRKRGELAPSPTGAEGQVH